MISFASIIRAVSGVALVAFFLTTGCVKIETGQTPEQERANSADRAHDIKGAFAEQFLNTDTRGQLNLLVRHFESYAGGLLEYSRDIAEQWRQGNEGRGQEIEASEMSSLVSQWISPQSPILDAWEDNLEMGVQHLEDQQILGVDMATLLKTMLDTYYDIYSVVMYPSSNVLDYRNLAFEKRQVVEELAEEIRREAAFF